MQLALGFVGVQVVAVLLLLTTHLDVASGQAYHFSKGWAAGKRSPLSRVNPNGEMVLDGADRRGVAAGHFLQGMPGTTAEDATDDQASILEGIERRISAYLAETAQASPQCSVRPEVHAIIEQLIQLESVRLQGCQRDTDISRQDTVNFMNWIKTKLRSASAVPEKK